MIRFETRTRDEAETGSENQDDNDRDDEQLRQQQLCPHPILQGRSALMPTDQGSSQVITTIMMPVSFPLAVLLPDATMYQRRGCTAMPRGAGGVVSPIHDDNDGRVIQIKFGCAHISRSAFSCAT